MLYVKIVDDKALRVATSDELKAELGDNWYQDRTWQCRCDWNSHELVERLAADLTEVYGETYLGTDAGPHRSPQYDIVRAPKVGDPSSYAFNGDSYPCGKVVSVSKMPACRVVTTEDADGTVRRFYRRRLSGNWVLNGTWSLVRGHVSEQNPSF